MWQFLRDTRDRPGAPLVRTRIAQGRQPDYYALTRQHQLETARPVIAATRVEDVHPAWKIIGHRHRRVYEAIVHRQLTDPQDVFAAAHISTSTGYAALAALTTAGLITRRRGHLSAGPVRLDDIAAAHHLDEQRTQRIQRHQRERSAWHDWLTTREDARTPVPAPQRPMATMTEPADPHRDEYLAAVLATGPPEATEEQHALELLADLVGASIVAVTTR